MLVSPRHELSLSGYQVLRGTYVRIDLVSCFFVFKTQTSMVIKKITENRKEIFRQNFIAILKAMDELIKIEVSREEISEFIYNWMHRKVIFEGKLIYDWETRKFIHESNYPQHLEYYQQYFPKIKNDISEQPDENIDSNNRDTDTVNSVVSEESISPQAQQENNQEKSKPKKKKKKTSRNK